MAALSNAHQAPVKSVSGWDGLSALERTLLNDFQRDFPLTPRPFAALAERIGVDEQLVLDTVSRLHDQGCVSRVGPVFRPHAVGASTLAALAVPDERLEEVAHRVNGYPEVNHNYQREHHYNLWFVATAPDAEHLDDFLARVERESGLAVLSLPLRGSYHIDLGFNLNGKSGRRRPSPGHRHPALGARRVMSDREQALVATVQHGFPLVLEPYAQIGRMAGMGEREVIEHLGGWIDEKIINRIGVVVRHHELGYRANAMAVWELPEERIDEVGAKLAAYPFVNLCYQRRPDPPRWRYNLFCMIHGQDREAVEQKVALLREECGLEAYEHAILFSCRRFKQRGARYCMEGAEPNLTQRSLA